jgi:hypothetical protein
LRNPQCAEQIRFDLRARFCFADFLDRAEASIAGVVHDDVNPTEPFVRGFEGSEDGGTIVHIEVQSEDSVTVFRNEFVESAGVACRRHDAIAAFECGVRPDASEPTRRTGDEPNF